MAPDVLPVGSDLKPRKERKDTHRQRGQRPCLPGHPLWCACKHGAHAGPRLVQQKQAVLEKRGTGLAGRAGMKLVSRSLETRGPAQGTGFPLGASPRGCDAVKVRLALCAPVFSLDGGTLTMTLWEALGDASCLSPAVFTSGAQAHDTCSDSPRVPRRRADKHGSYSTGHQACRAAPSVPTC